MDSKGIEVSEQQGKLNWYAVKEQGIPFAMLCAGCGDGVIDVQFRRNAKWCNWLEIPMGIYWVSYAETVEMARKEADHCVQTIEEFKVEYPVCFAFKQESAKYISAKGVRVNEELLDALTEAFCRRAEELGYLSVSYGTVFHNFLRKF